MNVREERSTEPLSEAIASRLLAAVGLVIVTWFCWLSMTSAQGGDSGFWPRIVLLTWLERLFG